MMNEFVIVENLSLQILLIKLLLILYTNIISIIHEFIIIENTWL